MINVSYKCTDFPQTPNRNNSFYYKLPKPMPDRAARQTAQRKPTGVLHKNFYYICNISKPTDRCGRRHRQEQTPMKKPKISLLVKVLIAIAAGIAFGQFLPDGIVRIFVTFNSLFGNFLSFAIPLIILGLVTPAIGDLGKGAGKLLLLTALIAYGSTLFSGFFTFFSCSAIFPHILADADPAAIENPENLMLPPYFTVAMPPLMDIMTALGLLESMLGFDETAQALMIALYIAMDSFGTACNVTGDGAIAVTVDKIAGKQNNVSDKDVSL